MPSVLLFHTVTPQHPCLTGAVDFSLIPVSLLLFLSLEESQLSLPLHLSMLLAFLPTVSVCAVLATFLLLFPCLTGQDSACGRRWDVILVEGVQQCRAAGSVAHPPGGPRVLPMTLRDVRLHC